MKILILITTMIIVVQSGDELMAKFSDGNKEFSANIYKELTKDSPTSFTVAPMSVDLVLALIHAGSRGNTAKEIATSLHFPDDKQKVQEIYGKLEEHLFNNQLYTLNSSTKVYIKKGFKIKDEYKRIAVNVYHSEIQNLDFTQNADTVYEINKWIANKTNANVKDFLKPQDLDRQTRIVLINTVYFDGTWQNRFPDRNTQKKTFYINKENRTNVDMMEVTDHFKYLEISNLDAKFIVMPFEGGEVSMTVALPNKVDGLKKLEENIVDVLHADINSWEKVHVQIPKFEMTSAVDYVKHLKAIGIHDAFDKNKADFRGIVQDPFEPLEISSLFQKTYFGIKEYGTTSTSATDVVAITPLNAIVEPIITPREFNVNHPFMFYIRGHYGILFIGRYSGLTE